ncbi:FAD-dependent monooxygenase [Actinoplanes sp. NPDC049265]|uniref:FAD-dependent monooxygenase n=1 Tax=Actinoplanes sp. NPDC049265 TaxID=3363902 RepID=UPI00371D6227
MFTESAFTESSVTIVGAGPTGLTLAIELLRRGVPHRIFEALPAPFAGSRGKGLQPRTLDVLDDLGVLDRFLAHGCEYPAMLAHLPDGGTREWRMAELQAPTPEAPRPNGLMIPQWRTGQLLLERLTELGGRVEFGSPVTALEDTTITLGTGEKVHAGYVVGCDGGRSTIRKLLGATFEGETSDSERMLIADVRLSGLDREFWHVWPAGQHFRLSVCPLPGTDDYQLFAPDATVDQLESLLPPGVTLEHVGWTSEYRPNVRMVSKFRHGNVFLAGDAAHVHPPTGAQGLNTGIQDAYNLGWKLATGDSALLDTYEAERLPVAAGVLGISTRLHRSKSTDRDDPALRQLSLSYREGPLAGPTLPGPVQAGDRAPDAPCGSLRVFDAFRGPHATVLAFDVPDAALPADTRDRHVRRVVRPDAPAGPRALVDVAGHAHRVYGATSPRLFEIRPDGYVRSVTSA